MIEFNVDKNAGIQLHTCERKSRWCKTLLLFSWLLLLPLLLGWLFWEGFLSLDTNTNHRNLNGRVTNTTKSVLNNKPASVASTESTLDCSAEIATSVKAAVAKSVNESKAKCDQQLDQLKKEITTEINDVKGAQLKGGGELSQQLVDANQELKTAQDVLRNSEQEIKPLKTTSSVAAAGSNANPNVDKDLTKKLYFYEKILDVSGNNNAIAIENFAIKPQDKERYYRFQLLLTKLGKHQKTTGSYDIFIKGNKTTDIIDSDEVFISNRQLVKKKTVTYKHTGLLPAENVATDNTFSFKYYQDLQGEIVLPENFVVDTFSVIIHPKNLSTVRNSYEWKKIKNQPFKEVL